MCGTGPGPTDEELVRRARSGDRAAENLLFERHREELRARLSRRLPRALRGKVAESDVIQEACLAALLHLEDFEDRGEGSFGGWLGAVVERKVLDELRRFVGTDKRDVAREVAGGSSVARLAGTSGDPSPSAAAIRDEDAARLAAAMERLPEPHRQVLRLIHEERLPLAEAGARMGRSADAVRKLYARAVLGLGEHLRDPDASSA
jgi:RNA polymerase sigma-70 factor (ECF subfamily)